MKLSGWARLWIVASVIWWVVGGIALSQQPYKFDRGDMSAVPYTYRMPSFKFEPQNHCTVTFPNEYYRDRAACLAKMEEGWRHTWARWLSDAWDSGHLPFLIFGPLVLAGLWLARNWVYDGFKASSGKKNSDPNPPDSA